MIQNSMPVRTETPESHRAAATIATGGVARRKVAPTVAVARIRAACRSLPMLRFGGALAAILLPLSSTARAEEPPPRQPPSAIETSLLKAKSKLLATKKAFPAALAAMERALEGDIASSGADSMEVSISLSRIADMLHTLGESPRALGMARRALEIQRTGMAETPRDLAKAYVRLADIESTLEHYPEAETAMREALRLQTEAVGERGHEALESRFYLGLILRDAGKLDEARSTLEAALADCERAEPGNPLHVALLLRLAGLLQLSGHSPQAIAILDRFDDLSRRHPGAVNPEAAVEALDIRAEIAASLLQSGKAETLLLEAVEKAEKRVRPDPALVANARNNLGMFQLKNGDPASAASQFRAAVASATKAPGPHHPDTARMLGNLATACMALERPEEQIASASEALRIFQAAFGITHPETLNATANLAQAYAYGGDFAKSEPLLRECLDARDRLPSTRLPEIAEWFAKLGTLQRYLGQPEPAFESSETSLRLLEQSLGPDHAELALALNNHGLQCSESGRGGEARRHFERALAICERTRPPGHHRTSVVLGNLALVEMREGKLDAARSRLLMVVENLRRSNGDKHWHTGNALGNLAIVEFLSGAYAGAASLFDESIAILENSPRAEPFTLQTLLRYKALNALHTEGPDSASARDAARRAVAVYRRNLARVLSFTTEQERLDWRSRESPLALIASLGMAEETAGLLLSSKGIVLDSIAEDRRAASRSGENWPQLQRLRGQVRAARLTPEHGAPEIAALEEECQRLERAIARETGSFGETRRSLGFSPAHIAEALPATSAYIDYFRYAHAIGDEALEERYAAIVITRSKPPRLVPLGGARAIDDAVALYQKSARGSTDEETMEETCTALHRALIAPALAGLPDALTTLVICPDAAVNRISFATLLDPGNRFLAETKTIVCVASGRDLLTSRIQDNPGPPAPNQAVIFSDIRYDTTADDTAAFPEGSALALRSGGTDRLAALAFPPLPDTAREGMALASALEAHGIPVIAHSADAASEPALRSCGNPRILHLATHGFFIAPPAAETGSAPGLGWRDAGASDSHGTRRSAAENPMLLSGLALAGASGSLAHWRRNQPTPPDSDGILLADEVAELDLGGVELVVLSACDTGGGMILSGEGVFGLRRGFLLAGAENLLLTLWPVHSGDTTDFMIAFYDRLLAPEGHPANALAATQRERLVRLREEHGLVRAVNRVGPFVLNVRGSGE